MAASLLPLPGEGNRRRTVDLRDPGWLSLSPDDDDDVATYTDLPPAP